MMGPVIAAEVPGGTEAYLFAFARSCSVLTSWPSQDMDFGVVEPHDIADAVLQDRAP